MRLPQDQRCAGSGVQRLEYVHIGGYSLQPGDPDSIPTSPKTRQREEGSSHGLHANVPHYPQCDAARPATFSRVILPRSQLNKKQQLP